MPDEFNKKMLHQLTNLENNIRSNVLMRATVTDAVEKILQSVENDKIKLKVNKIWVDEKHDKDDIKSQMNIRNKGQSWSDEIRADISLIDQETGKEVDRVDKMKISNVPKLTPRGTYLVKGNEYQFTKQSRLKPGVYTRIQNNGEISSFFNVDKTIDFDRGFNNNFKLNFNPENKVFTMGYGTKNVPLINALRSVGVNNDELKEFWGKDVYESNLNAYDKHEVRDQTKLYEAIFGKLPPKETTPEQLKSSIKDRLFATELDEETTNITLGKPFKKVDKGSLLTASKKILDIHRGKVDPDDRDSLIFKSFYDAEDFIREKLVKNSGKIINNLKYKLGKTRNLNKSLSSQTFDPFVMGTVTTSQLSNPPGQTNVMSMIGEGNKYTVMGEGGIGSGNAISDEARQMSNTEAGFIDPLHTPEGPHIGISVHSSINSSKIKNDLYTSFFSPDGKASILTPLKIYDKYVAFPDQYDLSGKIPSPKGNHIRAIYKGSMVMVPKEKIDYIISQSSGMFDVSSNMIPFLDSLQGNRGLTAAKMQEQAVTLKYRDKPLFKIINEKGHNIREAVASEIALPKSPVNGTIMRVDKDEITIKSDNNQIRKIQLYDNFPLNSESFLNNEPLVKAGDTVFAGQVLADNNNTRDGDLALGTNLKVAYMPYKGYNYEDSTIVSESAAKKLTSEHLYGFKAKRSSKGAFSKSKFKAYYPEELNAKQYDKLDKDGVIKPGSIIDEGDTIIAHMEKRAPTADDLALGRLDKQLRKDMSNNAVKWDKGYKGLVTSVEKHGNSVTVNVKTEEQLKVADKISGLHGNKHIVSKIVPDEEMPITADGERIDITMNPIGVSNRINTSQLLEAAAGKIGKKTGKQYAVQNFADRDNSRTILDDLKKLGLSDKEILIDPDTKIPYKNPVMTGNSHILKLEHKVDHKFSARYREGHDSNEQPVSGGETGGKNLGRMEMAALMARGAKENLNEMFNIKGQRNDEYWKALEMGNMLPPPKPSFAWNKQVAMMKGAGINVEQEGKIFTLKPLTDDAILRMSNGEIKRPWETYRKKDLSPMKEGLYDPSKAGGMNGDHYTHFKLPEPVLNPIAGSAAATLLDMPMTRMDRIIDGKEFVDKSGKQVKAGNQDAISGSPAIQQMLNRLDQKTLLPELEQKSKTLTNQTELNKVNKKIKYLRMLNRNGMTPNDYFINNALVVPSKFRPMFSMGTEGTIIMSDINDLYQQAAMTADAMKELKTTVKDFSGGNTAIENIQLAEIRGAMYNDMKAVAGLREPTAYLHRIKDKKGFITQIDGGKKKQTKEGFFQDKVLEKRQDLVGRSTIILNPELGGDQIGIPKKMANKIFQPFIMKELVGLGYSPLEAQKHIKEDSATFQKARQVVADKRLVIANRAPTLHRWNMTAFRPQLTDGKSIEVPSVVISKNFGADIDGDTFQLHVPIGRKALEEAERMLPSSDMLKTGYDTVLNKPDLDMVVGSWLASKGKGGKDINKKYSTLDDVKNDKEKGDVTFGDTVTIGGLKAKLGMHEINSVLPESARRYDAILDNKEIENWIKDVTYKHGGRMALQLADKMKDVGSDYVTNYGYTLGISDTISMDKIRDAELKKAKDATNIRDPFSIVKNYAKAKENIEKKLISAVGEDTMIGAGIISGGSKGMGNTSQILSSPILVSDANDNPIAMPITKSYSEGLGTSEYWAAAHGARGGNIKKSVQSYKPGWMTKDLMNSIYTTRIYGEDPVDTEGMEYNIDNKKNVINRYLAHDVKDSSGKVLATRNSLVDSDTINKLAKSKIKSVFLQSPLTDPTPGDGISSYSYGIDYKGNRYNKGDDIGVISAHTITEPSLNLSMKAFHTGGAFTKSENAFDALDRVLRFTKHIPNKATLASIDGEVKDIKKSSIGGYDVILKNQDTEERRYVDTNNELTIKKGDIVKKGDKISSGNVSMHDILKYKGMKETQKFLVDEIDKINENKLDRRDIEVLVRGITNTTRIMNPGTDKNYIAGDVAPLSTIDNMNNHRIIQMDIEESIGNKLNQDYSEFKKGDIINDRIRDNLYNKGIKRVEVKKPSIKHEPFLTPTGIGAKAGTDEDWIGRLAHNRIKDVLQQGATQGWVSDASGAIHPIPKLVTGL